MEGYHTQVNICLQNEVCEKAGKGQNKGTKL